MPNEPYSSELDALTAAPENHKLLFENDTVRMLDTVIQPGGPRRSTVTAGPPRSTSSVEAISSGATKTAP